MDRPKPLTPDRRMPVSIQLLFGMAGIIVSIAGIYELSRVRPHIAPTQHRQTPATAATTPQIIDTRSEAQKREDVARARAMIEQTQARGERAEYLRRVGARCMDGVLIIKEGNTISSAGRCQ